MLVQRAWLLRTGGTQFIKWTAEGAVKGRKAGDLIRSGFRNRIFAEYSATWEHTSVVQGMLVPVECMKFFINQGGTADVYSSLTESFSVRDFVIYRHPRKE